MSGVVEALEKNKGPNVESKGVKAHFLMDDSGLLNLINVELVVEKSMSESDKNVPEESPLSKLGSTISKLFTGNFVYFAYFVVNINLNHHTDSKLIITSYYLILNLLVNCKITIRSILGHGHCCFIFF